VAVPTGLQRSGRSRARHPFDRYLLLDAHISVHYGRSDWRTTGTFPTARCPGRLNMHVTSRYDSGREASPRAGSRVTAAVTARSAPHDVTGPPGGVAVEMPAPPASRSVGHASHSTVRLFLWHDGLVLATVSFYYGHRDPVSVTAG
jgi:hypothetical protein